MIVPGSDSHAALLLADENRATAHRLNALAPIPHRWVAITSFYSAVHYLGAYFLEQNGTDVTSHRHRSRLVDAYDNLTPIRSRYWRLYKVSLDARYDARARVTEDLVRLLLDDLESIRNLINRELQR